MKSVVIAGIIVLVLSLVTGYLVMKRTGYDLFQNARDVATLEPLPPPVSFDEAVVYRCSDDTPIAVAFKTGDTSVLELSLPDTNPLLLQAIEAASDAKYQSETGIVVWEKSGRILVENQTGVLYAECVPETTVVTPTDSIPASQDELLGTQWRWIETTFATGTAVTPNNPDDFTLTFAENNRFSANTDCNNIGGAYSGGADGALAFREMVATMMACEGEVKESLFSDQLNRVVSYRLVADTLVLSLKSDAENGEMRFTRK